MRRHPAAILILCSVLGSLAPAPGRAAPAAPAQWRSGLTEIDEGWATYEGDNMAWAGGAFDDSGWAAVDIEELGAAQPGWRWFRKHVNVGSGVSRVSLLISGGDGTYELFVNGERVKGAALLPPFEVTRPVEKVFELNGGDSDFEIALRTRAPSSYAAYGFPLFLSVTLGRPTAIGYERQALESERLYYAAPSVAINLLLVFAAIGSLALFASQKTEREYLFLALFLFVSAVSNGLWHLQQAGVAPISANFLLADPLIYLISISLIEFTHSFARRRVSIGWRVYECLLPLPVLLIPAVWTGRFSQDTYNLIEAGINAPLAILLPGFLTYWRRLGNREAGLLIVPSLVPTAMGVLYDIGTLSSYFGWKGLAVLIEPIQAGAFPLQISDLGSIVFLASIAVVMFFRFTRVSREQARSAAELAAAREIQQRLVPAALPLVEGYRIEPAYLPAQEVGGDFYQVLRQPGGAHLIVVGDVSGKGLKAAMTGTLAIGALRALAADGLGPAELLTRLNRQLAPELDGGFITCVALNIFRNGKVVAANAGHPAPYRDGAEIVQDGGLPLGIASGEAYAEAEFVLEAGQMLTLLSDGVVEARSEHGEIFGFDRTCAASRDSAAAIAATAQRWGQEDDITVLTVTRTGA